MTGCVSFQNEYDELAEQRAELKVELREKLKIANMKKDIAELEKRIEQTEDMDFDLDLQL